MCESSKQACRIEPPLGALLFLGLSVVSIRSTDGLLWWEPLPWLLLGISVGLWRAHGWARRLAIGVLTGLLVLLVLLAWPGGMESHPARLLLLDPWVAVDLEHHTGLHPTQGSALVASGLLLWLLSPPVRRAFALADLDAVRAGLPAVTEGSVKDDH
jgi:hypothetical protein